MNLRVHPDNELYVTQTLADFHGFLTLTASENFYCLLLNPRRYFLLN